MRFLILFFSFSLFADPIGEWVETDPPQEVEDDLVVQTPLVGVDANCNAVSVWLAQENFDSVRMDGAKLAFGSDIWIPTSMIVGQGFTLSDLHLEVAPCGDAVVVFVKSQSFKNFPLRLVCGARLFAGSFTWITTTPDPLNTLDGEQLTLSMNRNGDAIVAWNEESVIRAARLASGSTTWILTNDVVTFHTNSNPEISINNCGDAVIIWRDETDGVLRGARLLAGSQMWEPTGELGAGVTYDVALDDSGRAIAVFRDTNGVIQGSKLPRRTFDWVLADAPLSSGPNDDFPQVKIRGPDCRAVAIWEDGENLIIRGAVLPFDDNLWVSTSNLSSNADSMEASLAMDDFGNAVAVWNAGDVDVEGATLSPSSTIWEATNNLNTTNGDLTVFTPNVGVSPNGQLAVGVWGVENVQNEGFGVFAAKNCNPFAPEAVSHLFAEQVPNCFSSQTEYLNRIFWTKSPSQNVAFYRILRNGVEIGVTVACVFEDHNRKKGTEETYTVIAVSLNGKMSPAKSIVIKL